MLEVNHDQRKETSPLNIQRISEEKELEEWLEVSPTTSEGSRDRPQTIAKRKMKENGKSTPEVKKNAGINGENHRITDSLKIHQGNQGVQP